MVWLLTFIRCRNKTSTRQKPIMKSKNKSPFATICILLFHLGLLYLVYEKIAEQEQPKPKVQSEMQTNLP